MAEPISLLKLIITKISFASQAGHSNTTRETKRHNSHISASEDNRHINQAIEVSKDKYKFINTDFHCT